MHHRPPPDSESWRVAIALLGCYTAAAAVNTCVEGRSTFIFIAAAEARVPKPFTGGGHPRYPLSTDEIKLCVSYLN
jgi:hypothetical protein